MALGYAILFYVMLFLNKLHHSFHYQCDKQIQAFNDTIFVALGYAIRLTDEE